MSKCFIEFPNHNLFICYDNTFCYTNFMLSKDGGLYNFIQFIYQKNNMHYGIKQVQEFKNKDSVLYKLVIECINDILNDPVDHASFEYVILPNILKDENYLEIYLFRSNNYHDTFIDGISLDRLRLKIPLSIHIY